MGNNELKFKCQSIQPVVMGTYAARLKMCEPYIYQTPPEELLEGECAEYSKPINTTCHK